MSRREVVSGGLLGVLTAIVAEAFPQIWTALNKLPNVNQDPYGIETAIKREIERHYDTFVREHMADFWDGKDGFNLSKYKTTVSIDAAKPHEIKIGLIEMPIVQDLGDGTYEMSVTDEKPPFASFFYTVQKGVPFDYKRDFKTPLFNALKHKLPTM